MLETCCTKYEETLLRKYIKEIGVSEDGVLTKSQMDYFEDGYM